MTINPSCGCEQAACLDAGVHRRCPKPATMPCQYVGQLCDDCAETMRRGGGAEYLLVEPEPEGFEAEK